MVQPITHFLENTPGPYYKVVQITSLSPTYGLLIKVGSRLSNYKCRPKLSPSCCGLQKATFTLICRISIFWASLCSSSFSSNVSELSGQLDVYWSWATPRFQAAVSDSINLRFIFVFS